MVRIGKNVTFEGNRENIANLITKGMVKAGITGVNIGFVADGSMNIYGEASDLTTIKNGLDARGIKFQINGDAPAESVPTPEPQPTADEVTATNELNTAFNNVMESLRTELWLKIETEYNSIKTTSESFRRFTDIKHLRQGA